MLLAKEWQTRKKPSFTGKVTGDVALAIEGKVLMNALVTGEKWCLDQGY